MLALRAYRTLSAASQKLPILGEVRDFELKERGGRMLRRADLSGKVWIANFIFTHCAGICPMMSARMRGLQDRLKAEPDIRFVSFSVDPGRDTPEALRKYAARFQADPERWYFVTGEREKIYGLCRNSFHLAVMPTPPGAGEIETEPITHSSKFVLVDRAGAIRGYYDSDETGSMEGLVKDAKVLTMNK